MLNLEFPVDYFLYLLMLLQMQTAAGSALMQDHRRHRVFSVFLFSDLPGTDPVPDCPDQKVEQFKNTASVTQDFLAKRQKAAGSQSPEHSSEKDCQLKCGSPIRL